MVLALVALLAYLNVLKVPELQALAFWILAIAFIILALGIMMEGM